MVIEEIGRVKRVLKWASLEYFLFLEGHSDLDFWHYEVVLEGMGIVDGRWCFRYKRLLGLWWVKGDSILGKDL
jgi:hypothetical protein